jgi:hypothetical protein
MNCSGKSNFFRLLAVVTGQEWLGVTGEAAAAVYSAHSS